MTQRGENGNETTTACPECNSTQIARRPRSTTPLERWHCRTCKSKFRDPVRRESEHAPETRGGLARVLVEADPGEVS